MKATDPSRATVTPEDIEEAQAVINAWLDRPSPRRQTPGTEFDYAAELPMLRGLITQALTDAHAQGYDEGVVRGRRLIGSALRDLLEDEGL